MQKKGGGGARLRSLFSRDLRRVTSSCPNSSTSNLLFFWRCVSVGVGLHSTSEDGSRPPVEGTVAVMVVVTVAVVVAVIAVLYAIMAIAVPL